VGHGAVETSEVAEAAACLNCGEPLTGEYCRRCGQKARVHRSLGAIGHDLAHSVFHFEGKFWRTLPLLIAKPGELTRRYVAGERARFLSPIATFLLAVFLMFAVFGSIGREAYYVDDPAERTAPGQRETEPELPIDMDLSDAPGPLRWIDAAWKRAKYDPSLLAYKLQSNAYKYSWALIPISLPLVWILFLHRRRYRARYSAYDHAVFVTYSLAFMSLFAVVFTLLKLMGLNGTAALIPMAAPLFHMFAHLRGAYALSVWSASWRTVALVVFAFIAGGTFFMLLLMSGVLG
jgi:hypothetical protein